MKLNKQLFAPYLEPDEVIIEVFHKHPFTLIPEMGKIAFFGVFIPIFLYYVFPEFLFVFFVWWCACLIKVFYAFSNWYHDALIITNISLLDVTWNGFFHRTSSRLEYQNIQGISYHIKGFWHTVFKYGTITIQKNGGSTTIKLEDAINPQRIERLLLEHQEKHVSKQKLNESETLKALLTSLVKDHMNK